MNGTVDYDEASYQDLIKNKSRMMMPQNKSIISSQECWEQCKIAANSIIVNGKTEHTIGRWIQYSNDMVTEGGYQKETGDGYTSMD